MKYIFVNLKRFEVPRRLGGVCDLDSPKQWIAGVMEEAVNLGLGSIPNVLTTFILPEALLITAIDRLQEFPSDRIKHLCIGSQGVHREDIQPGGNFGAFTTLLPATAAKLIGCTWALIGHSEERKNLLAILQQYAKLCGSSPACAASQAIDLLLQQEVRAALNAGLNVLYCIGETADEKGTGSFEEQSVRIRSVLRKQLEIGLAGIDKDTRSSQIGIAYEPIWAIGPGKVPPDASYIDFVASFIKTEVGNLCGFNATVVYGGGLKEENAEAIARIPSIDGGLVALTRFKGNIGFYPSDLRKIIDKYLVQ